VIKDTWEAGEGLIETDTEFQPLRSKISVLDELSRFDIPLFVLIFICRAETETTCKIATTE
jgi:hypothetical protein